MSDVKYELVSEMKKELNKQAETAYLEHRVCRHTRL